MIRTSSADAYRKEQERGATARCQCIILDALREHGPMTRREIEERTGMRSSTVAGRVNELLTVGMVDEVDRRRCRISGRVVSVVAI
jgi:DNA-binding IclR family transcriptional regulator